jgi:phage/plasmid-associated DNA primase
MNPDDKELLDIAKQNVPPEKQEVVINADVQEFIYQIGIVANPNQLAKIKHIYWTYVKWCNNNDKEPLHKLTFCKSFGKRFRPKKVFNHRYYFVNKEPFILEDDEIFIMNAYYRKQRANAKAKKNKCKVSRPPETV